MICHFCKKETARKRGTNTLAGGKVQQIWHCRSCGRTWQTDETGNIVSRNKNTMFK